MAPENLRLSLIRPDDLLVLEVAFDQVLVTPPQAGPPPEPGSVEGVAGSRLTVHFQPQHIAEQAFAQASQDHQFPVPSDETPLPPGSVGARLAGPSRLVFDIPAGESFPLDVAGLLDAMQRLPLRVSAVNRWQPPSGCLALVARRRAPRVAPPPPTVTAIEAPYRLFLSPDELAHWRHALAPVVRGEWVELWHSRIGSDRRDDDPRLRAIWSPDFRAGSVTVPGGEPPFTTSLTPGQRNQIVHLTSNWRISGFEPQPVETEQLMLSSLGAWLEVEGSWDDPPNITGGDGGQIAVIGWRHEAKMARDQYVRVLELGYLLPFGHRAVLVTITERKLLFQPDPPRNVAYLYRRQFLIVREPVRAYSERDMPFRQVRIKTRVTPNLAVASGEIAGLGESAFWPRIDVGAGPVDFQFHLAGTDWEGRAAEWTAPLVFLNATVDGTATDRALVLAEYNAAHGVDHPRRRRPLAGQTVALAPADKPGDTAFEAADASFEAIERPAAVPHFRPALAQANVDIPAVKRLLGKDAPSTIVLEPTFVAGSGGGIGNPGAVFARLVGTTPLELTADQVGGMVAPDLGVSGLSRALGPVGGPVDQMVGGEFKPEDVFPAVKLFGGLDLKDLVLDLVFDAAGTTGGKIPGLTSERIGDLVRTRYLWAIDRGEMIENHPIFRPGPGAIFSLEAVVDTPLDGSQPTFRVDGRLTDFSVVLLPPDELNLVELAFTSVSFTALPGEKPDVSVELADIRFLGILEFVNQLQELIPLDGFSDPPTLRLVAAPHPGAEVGFTLGIPDIGIGVMTIQNVSLGASFFLPFGDAALNFHFAFCERQQPFILTVSLFGGGGFFGIDLGVDGVKRIEAALEFGASAAINLGVASGEASMMAGFYFQMAGADFELTGYFRAYGSLSVLGIITVSLEFYLGLTYATKGLASPHAGKLWGQASLKVKIEILFFSASVSVSMERAFAGSDPKFRDMLTPGHWAEYAEAFAPYP